jgi:hypothetical protein
MGSTWFYRECCLNFPSYVGSIICKRADDDEVLDCSFRQQTKLQEEAKALLLVVRFLDFYARKNTYEFPFPLGYPIY